jgi:hypothetical protein
MYPVTKGTVSVKGRVFRMLISDGRDGWGRRRCVVGGGSGVHFAQVVSIGTDIGWVTIRAFEDELAVLFCLVGGELVIGIGAVEFLFCLGDLLIE